MSPSPKGLGGLRRWLRPYAQALIASFPPGSFQVTSVRRSRSQQLALWRNRANNPYPVAPPGSSKHELGLAWDMVGDRSRLEAAGALWKSWGGKWWPADPIHFEY